MRWLGRDSADFPDKIAASDLALDTGTGCRLCEIEMRFQLSVGLVLMLATAALADEVTVALAVRDGGFEPTQIKTPSGGKIRLEVSNETASAIEFESFELNRERVIQPGQKAAVYLSGLSAGKYEFFDDFHPERKGVLVVE